MRSTFALLFAATLASPLAAAAPKVAGDAPSGTNLNIEDIAVSVQRSLDRTADPCSDFYRFACGGWLDQVELPADENQWVRSFSVIHERNRELLKGLIEDAAKNPAGNPERQKVGDFYGSCMDEAAVEAAGLAPVQPWLGSSKPPGRMPTRTLASVPLGISAAFCWASL